MEKVWEIKDPDEYLRSGKKKRLGKQLPLTGEKNPGRAYTLSLILWGVGQNYNDQRGKGLLFQLLLLIFFVAIVLLFVFADLIPPFLRSHGISAAQAFIFAELLFFCFLVFWMYIAGDAYHMAAKRRRSRFLGIQSHIYPFLCSLVLPGWGQFLNGQPVKGSIFTGFSVLGLFSIATIPATLLLWSSFEVSEARLIIEAIFTISVLYAPLIPFIWIFGSYDAFKVSLDELKKESLWERIKSANNRRRTQGLVSGVFPQIKSTIFLGLFLVVLVTVIYHAFPAGYYTDLLVLIRTGTREQGMTLLPDLIVKLQSIMTNMSK